MSRRKTQFGTCKLCAREGQLTFEHVPPRAAFNDGKYRKMDGATAVQNIESPPEELPYKEQQGGKGGHYFCENCNNALGAWYDDEYVKFSRMAAGAFVNMPEGCPSVTIEVREGIFPLRLFKAVMGKFCAVNKRGFVDADIRKFLLEKECTEFNKQKYRIFAYLYNSKYEKTNGAMPIVTVPIVNTEKADLVVEKVSEISTFPLGFVLYEDMDPKRQPLGYEITYMANYKYDDKISLLIELPLLKSHNAYTGAVVPSVFEKM